MTSFGSGPYVGALPPNDGQVKANFSGWSIPLTGGAAPVQLQPPLPLTFSVLDTRWPKNIDPIERNQDNLLAVDGTYGYRWRENDVDQQFHLFRWEVQFTRVNSASQDTLYMTLTNPVSGFNLSKGIPMGAGVSTRTVEFDFFVVADAASLSSLGAGNGYQFAVFSDAGVTVSPKSLLRKSFFQS